MRIGIIIGRIGDIDGVALETEKWIDVLQRMGHDIFILSGQFRRNIVRPKKQKTMACLSFFSPECEWEQKRAFYFPDDSPADLLEHLERTSDQVAVETYRWILENRIEALLVENASALPSHLSMGMAVKKIVTTTGIRTVTHDHDFYWERGERYKTPFKEVNKIIKSTFPLQFPHDRHAVINSHAQQSLMKRFHISSVIVPNVMDFSQPYGELDEYNRDLREVLGLAPDDIPLFQLTRIVRRKGIEVAVDLVDRLDDQRVKLVVTGSAADDERQGYYRELVERIQERKLEGRVHFGSRRIAPFRVKRPNGRKIYSLSDAYANATACTYFSTYEGFGNAFVEAVLARKPVFVNNYKPIFWPDIGSKGFRTVMLEDNQLTDEAVAEIDQILHDPKEAREIGEHNYDLAKKLFSYEVLEEKIEELFQF